mmetsp:Transcript_70430/g.217572  ORF Transcript_70430/g.217572 Transcript_70430/m.217572 type:complete len:108 (+) Transcript_70430:308-631(+)
MLGDSEASMEQLAKGMCPYSIGSSKHTQGMGCNLGCTCANSWMKTCWQGECSSSEVAGLVLSGGTVSSGCIARALGECQVATWVYVAGITTSLLGAAVLVGLIVMKK